jgi:zinc and cadmium transporter
VTPDPSTWLLTLAALVVVSSISLVGAITLTINVATLSRALIFLVAFAAGALLGDAFLHVIPEISESAGGFSTLASLSVLSGIIIFFSLEKILHWHHAHFPEEDVLHPVAVSNLVGDALHNFVDGAIVAGAFVASTHLGIVTSVAIALHEIPQELGDFAILIHSGLQPKRALVLNLLSALSAVVGGAAVLALGSISGVETWLLPFSAGAFVYIASTDLIPELHKEPEPKKSVLQLLALSSGVLVMAALLLVE